MHCPSVAFKATIPQSHGSRRKAHIISPKSVQMVKVEATHCSSQCSSQPLNSPDLLRRDLLSAMAGAVMSLPFIVTPSANAKLIEKVIPAKSLSSFQRRDLLNDFESRAVAELKKVVTSADAPTAMRLLLHDAATYDAVSRTGGVNGSVVLSEELNRPENKDLKDLVSRLSTARKALSASGPANQKALSWADTIVLAAKVTQQMKWTDEIIAKNPKNGQYLAANFANQITVRLGRLDASEPDAPGRFPAPGAPASEVLTFMSGLGVKDPAELQGPFAKKAPFWERIAFVLWTAAQPNPSAAEEALVSGAPDAFGPWKEKYDKSRATTFRQDYEVDFIQYLNKLADLGAKINPDVYLYDVTVKVPERL